MSQIAILNNSGGGGGSPIKTLTGDIGGAVSPDLAGNINLITGDGLTSTGTPVTNTITFTLDNFNIATGQTIGAVNLDVISINLGAVPTTYILEAKVVGFEATTPAGVAYNLICGARTNGAAATLTNVQDKYLAEEGALAATDANFVTVGNTVVVRVLGAAGLTINWKVNITRLGV